MTIRMVGEPCGLCMLSIGFPDDHQTEKVSESCLIIRLCIICYGTLLSLLFIIARRLFRHSDYTLNLNVHVGLALNVFINVHLQNRLVRFVKKPIALKRSTCLIRRRLERERSIPFTTKYIKKCAQVGLQEIMGAFNTRASEKCLQLRNRVKRTKQGHL